MIGRAYLWGLAANGQAGVENVLDLMRDGLGSAMVGLGRPRWRSSAASDLVDPARLRAAPRRRLGARRPDRGSRAARPHQRLSRPRPAGGVPGADGAGGAVVVGAVAAAAVVATGVVTRAVVGPVPRAADRRRGRHPRRDRGRRRTRRAAGAAGRHRRGGRDRGGVGAPSSAPCPPSAVVVGRADARSSRWTTRSVDEDESEAGEKVVTTEESSVDRPSGAAAYASPASEALMARAAAVMVVFLMPQRVRARGSRPR